MLSVSSRLSRGMTRRLGPFALARDDDEGARLPSVGFPQQQQREYRATRTKSLVLYGSVIVVSALSYVAYQKYHGEPVTPRSALRAQEDFKQNANKYSRAAFERRQRAGEKGEVQGEDRKVKSGSLQKEE